VRPPEPEIGRGEGARLAGGLGLGRQTYSPRRVITDGLGDPLGDRSHGGRPLQPPLAAVQIPAINRQQQPRRIQHIGQPMLSSVGVTHRVRQHHTDSPTVVARGRPGPLSGDVQLPACPWWWVDACTASS
jgi:hypothetical protein